MRCARAGLVCAPLYSLLQRSVDQGTQGRAIPIVWVHKSEESRRRLIYGGDENSDIREHVRSASSMAGTFVRGSM